MLASTTAATTQELPVEGREYTLEARHSHLMLDVIGRALGDGAIISQYESQNTDSRSDGIQQRWIFESASSSNPAMFRIKNVNSLRYLTAVFDFFGYGGTGRSIRQFAQMEGSAGQLWCLEGTGDGFFRIQSCDTQVLRDYPPVFLDVIGQNDRNSAQLGLFVRTDPGVQQMWKLTALTTSTDYAIPVGKPVLKWDKFCQSTCNIETTESLITVNGTETKLSNETKRSITNSISAGFEYSGVSASGQHSQTDETTVARTEAESFSKSMGREQKEIVNYDTNTYNIFSVWQWVAVTQMSDGTSITVNSRIYTCRPDANPPTYLPGSAIDIQSCHNKRCVAEGTPCDAKP